MENEILLIKINNREHADIYPDIVSVEAEEDEKLAGVFNIRLAIHLQKDGSWTWIDDERMKVWNKVSISAGFIDNLVEVISGYITQVKPYFDAQMSQCYLDIKGMDTSVLMNTEEKVKDWANKKDSDIATQIFTQYSLIPEVENTEIVHREAVSTIIQRETDLQFLQRLARRNGFECFVRGNTGYFRSPQLTGIPMKTLAVQFGTESNLSYFKAVINAQQPVKVEMHQLDLLTRENRDVSVESTQQRQLGKDSASGLYSAEVEPAKVFVKHAKANDQPAMQAFCQGLYDEAEWMLEGEGEIIGTLYRDVLRARELVTIKGVGKTYSGVYYVTRVKHVFTDKGYIQEFKVKRNALNPDGTEDFGAAGSLLSSG
jgi:phage protein D